METARTIGEARQRVAAWHRAGERVAFVPTMGNLHRGHLELVARARERAERLVVSIFVNPTQFGEGEDFDAYPRTLDADRQALEPHGVDLVFAPPEAEVYPRGRTGITAVDVPEVSEGLCGTSRPGHFRGVATVVAKLFNIVQPDVAVFGEKDFQQLAVIRRMVADLDFPVEVVGVPTVREADGLAMSSRNAYLGPEERTVAPRLYATLQAVAERLRGGERDFAILEREGVAALTDAGFRPDYLEIRRADDLARAGAGDTDLVVLAAARLGRARLIDNLRVEL